MRPGGALLCWPRALGDPADRPCPPVDARASLHPEVGEPVACESPPPRPPELSQRLLAPFPFPFHFLGPLQPGGASPPTSAAPVESRPPSQGGAEPPTLTMLLGAQDMSPHVTSVTAPGPWVQKPLHPQPLSAAQGQVSRCRGPLWPPVCAVPLGKSAHTLGPEAQGPRLALNLKLLLIPPHLVQPGRSASQAAGWRTRGAWPRSIDSGDPGQVTSHSRWVDVDPGPQKLPHTPTPGQVPETGMHPWSAWDSRQTPSGAPRLSIASSLHFWRTPATSPPGRTAEGSAGAHLRVCVGGSPRNLMSVSEKIQPSKPGWELPRRRLFSGCSGGQEEKG